MLGVASCSFLCLKERWQTAFFRPKGDSLNFDPNSNRLENAVNADSGSLSAVGGDFVREKSDSIQIRELVFPFVLEIVQKLYEFDRNQHGVFEEKGPQE